MASGALLEAWARLLFDSLARAGIERVIVSPGSRSTPFTWAALARADLTVDTIIDERAAAFYALGHAKVTGKPTLLVCTSGSAAANYLPAIVEADYSETPLVVLTADRPLELQESSSPQTIDQVKLYGDRVRAYFDLGVPDAAPSALDGLARIATQAVATSRSPSPGPVHLNARARKPLEPQHAGGSDAEGRALSAAVEERIARGPTRVTLPEPALPSAETLTRWAMALLGAERPLVVCGPAPTWRAHEAQAVLALSRAAGTVVACEAPSQLRTPAVENQAAEKPASETPDVLDGFELLLRAGRLDAALGPDLVLHCGPPLTSSRWATFLESCPEYVVIHDRLWPDPTQRAHDVIVADPWATARALADRVTELRAAAGVATAPPRATAFRERLLTESSRVWQRVEARLSDFEELDTVRCVAEQLPAGSMLALGNSLPIREMDQVLRASSRDISVWVQRGTNGIDGLIAGAFGAAQAAQRPTLLLLGDVSFAHDVGSLPLLREAAHPFVVVVLDNDGGRIFETLPLGALGDRPDFVKRAWRTPPQLDCVRVAQAFGLEAHGAEGRGIAPLVAAAFSRSSATVIRAKVAPESARHFFSEIDGICRSAFEKS